MASIIANKHIIVGVCGGIASYKAVELVSRLQQAGALVDVIMTEHAQDFVRPLTFSTVSHRPVYSNLWEASGQAAEYHVALAEGAELLALVPATAHTLAKLAHGEADNMLTTVALTTRAPLLLAPAMYPDMYTHPATQANLALLRERGAWVVEPEVGRLASGTLGLGRLPETETLVGAIRMLLGRQGALAGRQVVVTAGGTQEPIDPIRYIGNRSSGKMGYALAIEARDRGAQVVLISGPTALPDPYGVEMHKVETALQMHDAVQQALVDADVLVMNAAVADFRPAVAAVEKIKKNTVIDNTHSDFSLHCVRNPDILGELALSSLEQQSREQIRSRLVRVGFAAETHELVAHAQAKLVSKRLDLLIANDVSQHDTSFGADSNKVLIFHAGGTVEDLPLMSKADVAQSVWDRIISL